MRCPSKHFHLVWSDSLSSLSHQPFFLIFFPGSSPPLSPLSHRVSQAQLSEFSSVSIRFLGELISLMGGSAVYVWMTSSLRLQPGPLSWILGSYIQFSAWVSNRRLRLESTVKLLHQPLPSLQSCSSEVAPVSENESCIFPCLSTKSLRAILLTSLHPIWE